MQVKLSKEEIRVLLYTLAHMMLNNQDKEIRNLYDKLQKHVLE